MSFSAALAARFTAVLAQHKDAEVITIMGSRREWEMCRDALIADTPVIGECEECGHKIITPLKRHPAASSPSTKEKT